jgi:hypothetical protein
MAGLQVKERMSPTLSQVHIRPYYCLLGFARFLYLRISERGVNFNILAKAPCRENNKRQLRERLAEGKR